MTDPEPTFWQAAWTWIKRAGRFLLAPLPALILVALAIVLVSIGFKDLQIGGLLAKLFGKKEGQKAIDVVNSVPADRVDKNGQIIRPGTPDSKGITQAVVVPIQDPGLFSNPDTVQVIPPGKDAPITIDLPDGVRAKDVDKVIVVQPEVYAVTVKDSSKVPASKVDDLLSKYGS